MFYDIFDSFLCPIIIAGDEEGITNIHLDTTSGKKLMIPEEWEHKKGYFSDVAIQLDEYFNGDRKKFDLYLKPNGTDFQKSVWNALLEIPYGQVCSYKDIAQSIGNKKACRAIGMANRLNPIPIIIPCHRVIGSNGKLVGYAGGLEIKKELLKLEGSLLRVKSI